MRYCAVLNLDNTLVSKMHLAAAFMELIVLAGNRYAVTIKYDECCGKRSQDVMRTAGQN